MRESSVAHIIGESLVHHIENECSFSKAVLIDIDSSIFDFHEVFLPVANEEFNKDLSLEDCYSFDLAELYETTSENVLRVLSESTYMRDMKPFQYAKAFLQALRDTGHRIVICTSRTFAEHCLEDSLYSLRKHGMPFDDLVLKTGVKFNFMPEGVTSYELFFDDAPFHIASYFDADPDSRPRYMVAPRFPYNEYLHKEFKNEIIEMDLDRSDFLLELAQLDL